MLMNSDISPFDSQVRVSVCSSSSKKRQPASTALHTSSPHFLSPLPFVTSQEAKPYKNDPEIQALSNLVTAYMRHEIRQFEKLLKQNSRSVMGDPFIRAYIEDLLKNIRTQVLLKVITPYTRISIAFIASELNISASEVEQLLVALILDGQIDGQIDQIGQLLLLHKGSADAKKYAAAEKWANQLAALQQTIISKLT